MSPRERISAFEKLGLFIQEQVGGGDYSAMQTEHELLDKLIDSVHSHNPWFTPEHVRFALGAIARSLTAPGPERWIKSYTDNLSVYPGGKQVAVIMAGNIPLAGFHDFLCVLVSGNRFLGKTSSDDHLLLPFLAAVLLQIEPRFQSCIEFTDGMIRKMDAVIATGSTNSSRYFDYYFGKYPHIIRKNRNSIGLIRGDETPEDFKRLGEDIFRYFGLGCRNVSKLFVPKDYRFESFFEGIFEYAGVLQNNRYTNNYEYNKTIYLMKGEKMLDNNFLLIREDIALSSPIGVLFYEYYTDEASLASRLHMDNPFIQCMVSKDGHYPGSLDFGCSQSPALWDYADGVDTMKFLTGI